MKYDNIIFSDVLFNDQFSAWIEHYGFAFFLVEKLKPKDFVELGSHYGGSYFSFCQAIHSLESEAYVVDTSPGKVMSMQGIMGRRCAIKKHSTKK